MIVVGEGGTCTDNIFRLMQCGMHDNDVIFIACVFKNMKSKIKSRQLLAKAEGGLHSLMTPPFIVRTRSKDLEGVLIDHHIVIRNP